MGNWTASLGRKVRGVPLGPQCRRPSQEAGTAGTRKNELVHLARIGRPSGEAIGGRANLPRILMEMFCLGLLLPSMHALSSYLESLWPGFVSARAERTSPITAQALPAWMIGSNFVATLPFPMMAREVIAHDPS